MNVYDFDNTIYKGDSTADFYFFSLLRHPSIIKYLPSLLCAFLKYYLFKIGTKTQFKEKMFSFLKSVDIENDLHDFWEKHFKNIKAWYKKSKKDDDVIISASPYFLLEPVCKKLGIKHLIASRVDKKSGKYSGLNCHSDEKVRRFNEEFENAVIHNFYSDSKSDTPLARLSQSAYLVKGDKISKWDF